MVILSSKVNVQRYFSQVYLNDNPHLGDRDIFYNGIYQSSRQYF